MLSLFASCDVNDEFYNQLDQEEGLQLIENLEYTFTDDDYPNDTYFSQEAPAANYLPDFLAETYPTLDPTSTIKVTYNYNNGDLAYIQEYLDYLDELASIESYTLTTADYDSMGTEYGKPGYYNNFSSSMPAADYLPDFLLEKYPDAEEGDELMVTYKYYDSGVTEITEFWVFDGSNWNQSEKTAPETPDNVEVYELTTDDYDSMGTGYGEPGRYNNFSSSIDPDFYLPLFLANKYTYAAEGDKILVLYKFYISSNVETRAVEYTYGNGWNKYSPIVVKTDQYIKTDKAWLFDPTVLYTMVADDYQMIVEYVKENISEDYIDSYGTAESYYGSSSYYKEFNIEEGDYDASFGTWEDAVKAAMEVFLPMKFPEAVAQVEGIDVNYVITFAGYAGSMVDYTITFKCTKSAPNPTFEYVSGPVLK